MKKNIIGVTVSVSISLYIAFVLVTLPTEVIEYEREPEILATSTIEIVEEVKSQVPSLYPMLKRICSCESTGNPYNEPQQFNADGSVLRGRINPDDTGMCQINKFYHEESATRMGLNLETEYGNATYANWLFDTQGSTPWNWSKACWD